MENLHSLMAMAAGLADESSAYSSPSASRLFPAKTLADFPAIPRIKNARMDVSSELHLDIGFDTEYVYNPETQQNDILSYQSYTVLPDGTGVPDIIYPTSARKRDRLSLKSFLARIITRLLEQGSIAEWPGTVTIYAHFLRADVASFADFWADYKILFKGIRGTVSTFQDRYGIDFNDVEQRHEKNNLITFDKRTTPPRCSNVTFTDTLLLTPGGMGLAECGQLLNLPKLTIPAPYSITRMRQYLEADPEGFKTYALRDAEIAVRYALKVKDFCTRDLMLARIPSTIGAMAVSRFRKTVQDSQLSLDDCMGTETVTRTDWNADKHTFRTVKKTRSIMSRELFETFAINSYHGGRNECYMVGITPESRWYDYDLAGAHTTGLLDILQPDYSRIKQTDNPADFCGHVMGFAQVQFTFPESVRFPCLPVRTDAYGLFFPLSGISMATAPEIELALALGAKLTINHGIIVPWMNSAHSQTTTETTSSVFLPFVRQVRENRDMHPKGSLEEKFWKEIGNSLYGKLAQGLHAKTAFDTARGLHNPLPPSSVTQPFFAAHVTGFVRAVVGELMNRLPRNNQVVSVTTDGFLTNASPEQVDLSGPLSRRFQALCDIAAPDSSMLVCKHQVAQLIAMKTRGQLTMKAIPDQPIVHARAGVKPPSDIPREDYNDYMTDLYLRRIPGQTLKQTSLISTQQMWMKESDLVNLDRDIRLNLEFDFKRRLYQPIMNDGHLFMLSHPWQNIEEALVQRQLFDDWRQSHTLKELTDWDDWQDFLYCRSVFSTVKLKVGEKRSDDILKTLLIRALTQSRWGLTKSARQNYTNKDIAQWLTDNDYPTTENDLKNATRGALPAIHFHRVTPAMQDLITLFSSRFPGLTLP